MNVQVRNARLQGSAEGHRVLAMMEARERIARTDGQIDVFGTLADLDIFVMFKPLDGLLGAFLKREYPGVLISTKRPYSVQRFTGAHELGHAVLNHEPSLDSPGVIRRASLGLLPPGRGNFRLHLQEIEADAFASEFLTPKWLLVHHAKAQGWNVSNLAEPEVAYQLALRCGCSYEATLRSLARNGLISDAQVNQALKVQPKALKAHLRGEVEWVDPWSDVWRVRERDLGHSIPAAAGDTVRLELLQHSAGGYLWQVEALDGQLPLLGEDVQVPEGAIGAPARRLWWLRADGGGPAKVTLVERRPWETEGKPVELQFNIRPKETGLSRANRAKLAVV